MSSDKNQFSEPPSVEELRDDFKKLHAERGLDERREEFLAICGDLGKEQQEKAVHDQRDRIFSKREYLYPRPKSPAFPIVLKAFRCPFLRSGPSMFEKLPKESRLEFFVLVVSPTVLFMVALCWAIYQLTR